MLKAKSTLLIQRLVGNRSSSTTTGIKNVARRSLATLQSTQKSNNQGEIITFLGLNNLSDNSGAVKKVRIFTNIQTNKQTHEIFFFSNK